MDKIDKFILKHWNDPSMSVSIAVGLTQRTVQARRCRLTAQGLAPKSKEPKFDENIIESARKKRNEKQKSQDYSKRENKLVEEIERLSKELEASRHIKEISSYTIKPKVKGSGSESVAVLCFSDWHIEENVKPQSVSGLNEFTLDIAEKRIKQLWQTSLKMINNFSKDTEIKTCVLWLGGDFISGNIHEELLETCSLLPMDAIVKAQEHIVSGINFLLENSDLDIVCPTSCGNHSRITPKSRVATMTGNSLEYLMYHNLALYYKNNKRIKFVINQGYHTYVDVLGYTLRFHHGDQLKFGGGIGGIFIPAFKAISQWNKGRRADQDIFGHFHARKDGGNFVCNGSVVGYSAYALSIKADYEKPSQLMFLVNKKLGKTVTAPIILD